MSERLIPCLNPEVCGVKNHKTQTEAECRSQKSKARAAAKVNAASKLSSPPPSANQSNSAHGNQNDSRFDTPASRVGDGIVGALDFMGERWNTPAPPKSKNSKPSLLKLLMGGK